MLRGAACRNMSRTSRTTTGSALLPLCGKKLNAFARLNSFWEAIKNKSFELQRCRAGLRKPSHFWSMELFFFYFFFNLFIFSWDFINRIIMSPKSTSVLSWPCRINQISPAYDWRSWCPAESSHRPPAVDGRWLGPPAGPRRRSERWLRSGDEFREFSTFEKIPKKFGAGRHRNFRTYMSSIVSINNVETKSRNGTEILQTMSGKYCRPSFVVFRLLSGWWYAQKKMCWSAIESLKISWLWSVAFAHPA